MRGGAEGFKYPEGEAVMQMKEGTKETLMQVKVKALSSSVAPILPTPLQVFVKVYIGMYGAVLDRR